MSIFENIYTNQIHYKIIWLMQQLDYGIVTAYKFEIIID